MFRYSMHGHPNIPDKCLPSFLLRGIQSCLKAKVFIAVLIEGKRPAVREARHRNGSNGDNHILYVVVG